MTGKPIEHRAGRVGRSFIFWAAVLLLVVPGAAAQSTADIIWAEGQEGELNVWRTLELNIENGGDVKAFNMTWLDFSPYENAIPQSMLFVELSHTVTIPQNGTGTWNYTLEADSGIELDECFWHVTIQNPGVLGGDPIAYATYNIFCAVAVILEEDQVVNFWINRTVLSGTPSSPIDEHITVKGDRGDFIVTGQANDFELLTGVSGLEFLVFIVVIGLTIVLWSRSTDHIVHLFSAVLLMFFAAIAIFLYSSWVGWAPFGGAIGVLGGYILARSIIEWISEE